MTDPAAPTTPAATPAAPAPAAPTIDVDAITKKAVDQAVEKATAAAEAKLKEASRVLSGEPAEKKELDPLARELITDPLKVLSAVKDQAKKEAKEDFRKDELAAKAEADKAFAVAKPFMEEHPELVEKTDTIDAFTRMALQEGKSLAEAVEFACKKAITEHGLKAVSAEERERRIRMAAIPGMGGGPAGRASASTFNNTQSELDYIQAAREKVKSFRTKRS